MVAGVVPLVLPGPGVLTILAGLSLLATEFVWARRLRSHLRRRVETAVAVVGRHRGRA